MKLNIFKKIKKNMKLVQNFHQDMILSRLLSQNKITIEEYWKIRRGEINSWEELEKQRFNRIGNSIQLIDNEIEEDLEYLGKKSIK